ncbi:hypothetical protein T4A_5117, partial [Trichinella pseudospiralis]
LWFILVEEDELPFLCFVQASEGKVPFTTMRERTSRAMGKASFQTHFNITVIICAPRFACFTATVNFIKGFQSELEDEMKILNIKVDGVLNSTLEGYYLISVKCPKNYKIDLYRINTALGSIRKKNSGSMFQMVAVIVDKCLEMVLKTATVGSWPPVKVHVLFV